METSFYLKLLGQIFLPLRGKRFQASHISKIFAERKASVLAKRKREAAVRFLSLGTARGRSQRLARGLTRTSVSPPQARSPLLTSASTSFFFMPSEESSRFCSFSSSRSARSFAWRMFCSSSVASALAFTAYQETGNRT